MSDDTPNQKLERLFETILLKEGAPLVEAHVTAQTSGTLVQGGVPEGHNDDMFALGFIMSGAILVRPSDGEDEWVLMRDEEHSWMATMMLTREGAQALLNDLVHTMAQEG